MMKRFEYARVETTRKEGVDLNKLGLNGWDIFSVVSLIRDETMWQDYVFFMKRELKQSEEFK